MEFTCIFLGITSSISHFLGLAHFPSCSTPRFIRFCLMCMAMTRTFIFGTEALLAWKNRFGAARSNPVGKSSLVAIQHPSLCLPTIRTLIPPTPHRVIRRRHWRHPGAVLEFLPLLISLSKSVCHSYWNSGLLSTTALEHSFGRFPNVPKFVRPPRRQLRSPLPTTFIQFWQRKRFFPTRPFFFVLSTVVSPIT